jgi:hypothetical protein
MANATFRDLRQMKREIDSLYALAQRKHLGKTKHDRLESLLSQYGALRNQLEKRKKQLDDAEIDAIRASKSDLAQRSLHLDEVNCIRRERRKLFGEA